MKFQNRSTLLRLACNELVLGQSPNAVYKPGKNINVNAGDEPS